MNLLGQPVTALEVAAFVTGLATVWLTKIRHIWNWPVSLVNVARSEEHTSGTGR